MFRKALSLTPWTLLITSLLAASIASAQDPACPYTLSSLQGPYTVVLTYGANLALGIQTQTLDGKGNLIRSGVINQPTPGSTTGARTIVTTSSVGTYTVNCNGTGTFVRVITLPDGSKASASDDFIITSAIKQEGRLIATTITDAQRDPSVVIPGGVFVTRVHTRLPEVLVCASCARIF
jgi:hypothetical protein